MSLKIGIKTMGCRLNHAEAAQIAGACEYEGFQVVSGNSACDVLILHTCVITAAAQSETVRRVRAAKRRGVGCLILSGCASRVLDATVFLEAGADGVVDKKTGALSGGVDETARRLGRVVSAALSDCGGRPYLPVFTSTRAPVKVQDGCSFRCAYCIVPDTRGEPRSRAAALILDEIAGLAGRGFREVVLTGVNVACWHDAGRGLADLARAAGRVEGIARVRLSSIEPGTAERAIVDLMAEPDSRLCRTLHYPLQSGDAGVLRRMRRRYTPEGYRAAVAYALERVPRLGLGADIITGFPGEDDAAFAGTVRLVESYPFNNLHVFPYSERPGTPAAEMTDAVPVHVRRERARELIAIGARKRAAFAASLVGETVEVLIERVDDTGVGRGWTSEYVEAHVDGLTAADLGQVIRVTVGHADDGSVCASAFRGSRASHS